MPTGVYIRTKEYRENMRNEKGQFIKGNIPEYTKGMLGKHHSEITKKKMSKNNGRYWQGKHFSEETKKKLKKIHIGQKPWNRGLPITEKTRRKISEALKGKKFSEKHRRKISEVQKGENGNNWQGGITPENAKIRNGIEFRLWREAIFARDNWTCQKCKERGKELHPHHILNFAEFPELRFAINNGITFCKNCHKKFHKKYGKKNNTRSQLLEFLCLI